MSKLFQRKPTHKTRTAYNYRPNSSLSDQEKAVNRRLVISFLIIIAISSGLYFWGIEVVASLSDIWRTVLPNSQIFEPGDTDIDTNSGIIFAPRLDPLPMYTNESSHDLKGWAQPGVEVKLTLNEQVVAQILTDSSGRFEYSSIELQPGENQIYAETISNDKLSEPSEKLTVQLDTVKPEISVNVKKDEITDVGILTISGETETTADVYINDHRVILHNDGSFEYTHQLNEGTNDIIISVTDEAGNENVVTDQVEYSGSTEEQTPDANADNTNKE